MPTRAVLFFVVMPPVVLAAISAGHPASLTVEDAHHWQVMHTWLIPVFPLLALGPWLVARLVDPVSSWVVALPAYTYACFYTALDILAGVGGGAIKDAEAGGLGIIFPVAGDFEQIGGIAFVIACALGAGVALRGTGWIGLPAAIIVVVAAVILWREHIYPPWGPVVGVMLAVGWGALAVLIRRPGITSRPTPA